MSHFQIVLYMVQLVFGGLAAILAVMIWGRMRSLEWMCLSMGVIVKYSAVVYNLLLDMGIISPFLFVSEQVPITSLVFGVMPSVLFVLSFILFLRHLK